MQGPTRPEQDTIGVSLELSNEQRGQLISAMARTTSYPELRALLKQSPDEELDGSVAACAMLQAANLKDTVGVEVLAEHETFEQANAVMDAQQWVLDAVTPSIERYASEYPPHIQVTLASAMAQLDYYSESTFSAVAHTCCLLDDATGGMVHAVEQSVRAAAEAAASATAEAVVIEPPGTQPSAPSSNGAAAAAATEHHRNGSSSSSSRVESYEYGVLGVQLMMTSSAYALVGHYDEDLFDIIARQTVHYLDNIADLPTLINILCAFMDVQHLDRELLEAAGLKLADEMASLEPADAAAVLLVYAFFKVKNPAFYEGLLAEAAQLDPEAIDAKTASALYRGIKLLPDPVPIPPAIDALFKRVSQRFNMLELSVASTTVSNLNTLDVILQDDDDEAADRMIYGFGMADLAIRRQLYNVLTRGMGFTVARNMPVTADGWLPLHLALQFEGVNVGWLVFKDGKFKVRNDMMRCRGQVLSEIRCMNLEGWVVLPMEVSEWRHQMAGLASASDRSTVDGDAVAGFLRDKMTACIEAALEEE